MICVVFSELYDSPALQAVQLEDGSTAFIQQALQMSTPDTILAIQESDTVSDLPLEEITDPETVTVLEQYAAKVTQVHRYTITYERNDQRIKLCLLKPILDFTDRRNGVLYKHWNAHK